MAQADRNRWDDRYRGRPVGPRPPDPFLAKVADQLPGSGRALDLAGGDGRHAIWLARRGLQVTLADISEVALDHARAAASSAGVAIRTVAVDFEHEFPPPGPWDLIVCVLYLDRPLLATMHTLLAPGGLFVFVQPTRRNLERHTHAAGYLLDPGEAPGLLPGMRLLRYDEDWDERGQHEARILATC